MIVLVSKLLKYAAIVVGAVGVGAVIYYYIMKPMAGLRARTVFQVKALSPSKYAVTVNGAVTAAEPDVTYFDLSYYYTLGAGARTLVAGVNWANPEEANLPHQGLPPKVGESRVYTSEWIPPGPGTYKLEGKLYMRNTVGELDIWSAPVTVTVVETITPQGTVTISVV